MRRRLCGQGFLFGGGDPGAHGVQSAVPAAHAPGARQPRVAGHEQALRLRGRGVPAHAWQHPLLTRLPAVTSVRASVAIYCSNA